MEAHGFSFREFLENWSHVFLRLDFLFNKALALVCLGLLGRYLKLVRFVSFNSVKVNELSFIVLEELVHGPGAISSALSVGMGRNPDNSDAAQAGERLVLKLLRDSPRDEITRWSQASLQVVSNCLFVDFSFVANLNGTQDVGQAVSRSLVERSEEHEHLVGRCVREQLEVIGGILVVTRHEYVHDLAQELLSTRVVAKQGVSVHEVQVALVRVRVSLRQGLHFFGCVQAEQVVEPLFDGVVVSVPDWLVQANLFELAPMRHVLLSVLIHVSTAVSFQLTNQLQRQRSAGSFVTMDSG